MIMPTHEYFRKLSALAEVGEISEKEHSELQIHLRGCPECRQAAQDYREILFDWLPLHRTAESETSGALRPGFGSFRSHLGWIVPIAAVLVLAIAVSVLWTARNWNESASLRRALDAARLDKASLLGDLAGKEQRIKVLERSLADRSPAASVPADREPSRESVALQEARARLTQLQAETDRLRSAYSTGREEEARLSRELQEARAAQRDEQKRSSDLQTRKRELEAKVDNREAQIKGLSSRLAFLDARIKAESEQNGSSSGMLDRLIHDPSLQVINVYAVSNKSKKPSSFCRILKVADAPPVIYAYRLTTGDFAAPDNQRHFQVWGMNRPVELDHLGLVNPAEAGGSSVRLGELRKDASSIDRWILQLPDSKALSDIRYLLITEGPVRSEAVAPPVFLGTLGK